MRDGLAQLPGDMPARGSKSWRDFSVLYRECWNEVRNLPTIDADAWEKTKPNDEDRGCREREADEEGGLGVRACD